MDNGLKYSDATTAHPSQLCERDLTSERHRLEALLENGKLTPKDGRRLQKIREALAELEMLRTDSI